MNIRRTAAVAVCAAVLAPLPAADAARMPRKLTITGNHNSYAVLTVTETTHYTLGWGEGLLAGRSDADEPKVDYLSGGGRYGGFAIGRDTATLWSVYMPTMPTIHGDSWDRGVLKPGSYRVYLFAEQGRQVTVTVPWTGPNLTLTTQAPIDASFQVQQAVGPRPDRPLALTIPQDGRRRANTDATLFFESAVAPSITYRLCLTRDPSTCDTPVRVRTEVRGRGTALNGWGTGFGLYNNYEPTKGLHVRGEVSGTTVGLLTVATLRYYR